MSSILQTYYRGILKRLKAEIDLLNDIIPHATTKGTANEESLKQILENFIPKKYAIGSGIIIDSFGNRSKQIDIVIYDQNIYPNLFSQTSTSIFPVETVIATIEVKTFLDNSTLNLAAQNTKSIKDLKHYVEEITLNQPDPKTPLNIKRFKTTPPLSFLFAFRSDSNNPKTWNKRFENCNSTNIVPDISYVMNISSVFYYRDLSDRNSLSASFFHLRECDFKEGGLNTNRVRIDKKNEKFFAEGDSYESSTVGESDNMYYVQCPERAFLAFLIQLVDLLDAYPRHTKFEINKYLDDRFMEAKDISLLSDN